MIKAAKYIGILILGLLLGWIMFTSNGESPKTGERTTDVSQVESQDVWTCSMHPQVRQPEPGQCPICGMDLIPAESGEDEEQIKAVELSRRAVKLAGIQTTTVQSQSAEREVKLFGTIEVDERGVSTQSAHIPGRIEKLYVHYEGERVQAGQLMAKIYSPELVTAQEELLEARNYKDSQPGLFEAARQKLNRWKISEQQIDRMLEEGTAIENFPIYADQGGFVNEIMSQTGNYVEKGDPLYKVANLNTVWAVFDAYESDLSEIEEGMTMEFKVRSLPDKTFSETIEFVDPYIPSDKRAARLRLTVSNYDGKLKPGMFATGKVQYKTGSDQFDLVVPKSAVLWTGERSLVYVEDPAAEVPTYRMRTVELGSALEDQYLILDGLFPGEKVVTHSAFTVDAAAQLAGVKSMMMPTAEPPERTLPPEEARVALSVEAREQLNQLIDAYLKMKNGLVRDSLKPAVTASESVRTAFDELGHLLEPPARTYWKQQREGMVEELERMNNANDLEGARTAFIGLSKHLIELVASYRRNERSLFVQHCPMAQNNQGADWLSEERAVRNPYFGSEMLNCGKVVEEF